MVRPMRKRDDNESEGEGEEDMAEEEASKQEEDRQSEPHQKTSSHHLNRKCLVGRGCSGYIGPNLKRLFRMYTSKRTTYAKMWRDILQWV